MQLFFQFLCGKCNHLILCYRGNTCSSLLPSMHISNCFASFLLILNNLFSWCFSHSIFFCHSVQSSHHHSLQSSFSICNQCLIICKSDSIQSLTSNCKETIMKLIKWNAASTPHAIANNAMITHVPTPYPVHQYWGSVHQKFVFTNCEKTAREKDRYINEVYIGMPIENQAHSFQNVKIR